MEYENESFDGTPSGMEKVTRSSITTREQRKLWTDMRREIITTTKNRYIFICVYCNMKLAGEGQGRMEGGKEGKRGRGRSEKSRGEGKGQTNCERTSKAYYRAIINKRMKRKEEIMKMDVTEIDRREEAFVKVG